MELRMEPYDAKSHRAIIMKKLKEEVSDRETYQSMENLRLTGNFGFVAFNQQRPVGFIHAIYDKGNSTAWALFVYSFEKRLGVGKKLIETMIDALTERKTRELTGLVNQDSKRILERIIKERGLKATMHRTKQALDDSEPESSKQWFFRIELSQKP